jgi:hypothetical protein
MVVAAMHLADATSWLCDSRHNENNTVKVAAYETVY